MHSDETRATIHVDKNKLTLETLCPQAVTIFPIRFLETVHFIISNRVRYSPGKTKNPLPVFKIKVIRI